MARLFRTLAIAMMGGLATAQAAELPTGSSQVWPGFRGTGDGRTAAKGLPLNWSESENIAWKIDLPGYGQSTPVVWKDKLFVTAVEREQREVGYVLAYDAKSGKELWRHRFEPTQKANWSYTISRAAPTPAVDENAVYALFEGGNLLAFDHAGKTLWDRSLVSEYGEIQGGHGLGSSPAQTKDAIIVLIDHRGPSYLVAFDKKTGKTLWKTDRESKGSWASPVVAHRNGNEEIVVSSGGSVTGYDPKTGKQLWQQAGVTGNSIPSASVLGDLVLVGAGRGRGDAEAEAGETPDPNTVANCLLRLTETSGGPGFELAWKAPKATAYYATPLAHNGQAYFVNQVGVVYCVDLATGKELYAKRIDAPCWSSPIGAGEFVYFFGKDGRTTVLRAGKEFDKVASNRLWDPAALPPRKLDAPKQRRRNADESKEGAAEKGPSEKSSEKQASGKSGRRRRGGMGGPGGNSEEYLDPIVYGVSAVDGAFFVRTGTAIYRIGKSE